MKVIFSRKGFDSTAGGCPSPLVDGCPVSFPIPTKMPSAVRYGDLNGPYGELVGDLTKGRRSAQDWCHLDPDISAKALSRLPGWRGALGQTSAAQGHLRKQDIQVGDLFIFWGLFRPVEKVGSWQFTGAPEHRIWGWLQIGEIIHLGPDGSDALEGRPWLRDHPHVRPGWGASNTLYVASDETLLGGCRLDGAGSGVLQKGHRLTAPNCKPSTWGVPDWLHPQAGGCGMTYHPYQRWGEDGTVTAAARGQEFVARPIQSSADAWIKAVLREAS